MVFGNQNTLTLNPIPALPIILLWDIKQIKSEPPPPNLLNTHGHQLTRVAVKGMHSSRVQGLEQEKTRQMLFLSASFSFYLFLQETMCSSGAVLLHSKATSWFGQCRFGVTLKPCLMLHFASNRTPGVLASKLGVPYGDQESLEVSLSLTSSWLQAPDLPFPGVFTLQTCDYKSFLCSFEIEAF